MIINIIDAETTKIAGPITLFKYALIGNFISPPDKFGEVAFYWWIGDKLTKKRLLYQLDKLKNSHVTGLQINYCHTDKGGYSYGLPYQSDPPLFSEKSGPEGLQPAAKDGIVYVTAEHKCTGGGQCGGEPQGGGRPV